MAAIPKKQNLLWIIFWCIISGSLVRIGAWLITVVVVAIGCGYFFLNRGSLGKEAEPKTFGAPGVVPKGANPNIGPFPSDTLPNGNKMGGGAQAPSVGAPPPGVTPPGSK